MIGIVFNKAWAPSALPYQCAYTWYREADQTVIVVYVQVPLRRGGKTRSPAKT